MTTKYDERGRPIAQTEWFVTRGTIDPDAPPIAGEGGISASDGLTTRWEYDDDLDDTAGLDDDFADHLTGLDLGTDSDGSAALVTNPEGERTLAIRDGRGSCIRLVQLNSGGEAVAQAMAAYDALSTIGTYGDVLETAVSNLSNATLAGLSARCAIEDQNVALRISGSGRGTRSGGTACWRLGSHRRMWSGGWGRRSGFVRTANTGFGETRLHCCDPPRGRGAWDAAMVAEVIGVA